MKGRPKKYDEAWVSETAIPTIEAIIEQLNDKSKLSDCIPYITIASIANELKISRDRLNILQNQHEELKDAIKRFQCAAEAAYIAYIHKEKVNPVVAIMILANCFGYTRKDETKVTVPDNSAVKAWAARLIGNTEDSRNAVLTQ
jgi:NADPH-dependent ferric siderophore reductase